MKSKFSRIRFLLAITGIVAMAMFGNKAYAQATSQANSAPNPVT